MKRLVPFAALTLTLALLGASLGGGKKDNSAEIKEALQAFNEYIGRWKGTGSTVKDGKFWQENADWSWRFKGGDMWLTFDLSKGALFKGGEIRYLPAKDKYQLTMTDAKGAKQVFEGEVKKNKLIAQRVDSATKETHKLQLNLAGGGIRFICTYETKPENRTLYTKVAQIDFTKEGESFGVSSKKGPECIVTGGLGTITVGYNGMTFYVCCSGCRDAFNENPAKYVAEYLKRKKAGK